MASVYIRMGSVSVWVAYECRYVSVGNVSMCLVVFYTVGSMSMWITCQCGKYRVWGVCDSVGGVSVDWPMAC